jgi:hypothetical protein
MLLNVINYGTYILMVLPLGHRLVHGIHAFNLIKPDPEAKLRAVVVSRDHTSPVLQSSLKDRVESKVCSKVQLIGVCYSRFQGLCFDDIP